MSKKESRNADYCQKHYLNNTQALISGCCITGVHLLRALLSVPCSQRVPLGFSQTTFSANLAIRKHLTSGQHHSQKGSLGSFKKKKVFSFPNLSVSNIHQQIILPCQCSLYFSTLAFDHVSLFLFLELVAIFNIQLTAFILTELKGT